MYFIGKTVEFDKTLRKLKDFPIIYLKTIKKSFKIKSVSSINGIPSFYRFHARGL